MAKTLETRLQDIENEIESMRGSAAPFSQTVSDAFEIAQKKFDREEFALAYIEANAPTVIDNTEGDV